MQLSAHKHRERGRERRRGGGRKEIPTTEKLRRKEEKIGNEREERNA